MSEGGKTRQRAVKLTPEAIALLKEALTQEWARQGTKRKLTREYRATLLQVSVVTAHKILDGEGVDRSSLLVAFNAVGLAWKEEFCQSLDAIATDDLSQQKIAHESTGNPDAAARLGGLNASLVPGKDHKPWFKFALVGFATVLLILMVFANMNKPGNATPVKSREYYKEYDQSYKVSLKLFQDGRYYDALKAIENTFKIVKEGKLPLEFGLCSRLRGEIHSALGNYDLALQDINNALKYQRDFEGKRNLPQVLEVMGDLETKMGRLDDAEKHLLQSRAIYIELNSAGGIAMAERDLGSVYHARGDHRQARTWFASARNQLVGLEQDPMMIDINARDAMVILDLGRAQEAQSVLRQCLNFWESKKHPRWVALTQRQLAQAEFKLGNRTLAVSLLESSYGAYRNVGDTKGAAETEKWLRRFKPMTVARIPGGQKSGR